MKNNLQYKDTHLISSDGSIPQKSVFSYILMLFPAIFILPWLKKITFLIALKNCRNCDFEPGFRFFYGDKVHAVNVVFSDVLLMDYADITIEKGTVFGKSCKIITATHDFLDKKKITAEPVHIGKNVLINTGVIILGNVTIGANSVIGAGSVVTHNIPADCLAAGNPAKIIKRITSE